MNCTENKVKKRKEERKKENIIRNKVNKEQMFIKQCYSSKEINSENKLLGFVTWCNLSRLNYF